MGSIETDLHFSPSRNYIPWGAFKASSSGFKLTVGPDHTLLSLDVSAATWITWPHGGHGNIWTSCSWKTPPVGSLSELTSFHHVVDVYLSETKHRYLIIHCNSARIEKRSSNSPKAQLSQFSYQHAFVWSVSGWKKKLKTLHAMFVSSDLSTQEHFWRQK